MLEEAAEDVVLHAAVHQQHLVLSGAVLHCLPGRYHCYEVVLVGVVEGDILIAEDYLSKHGALLAELLCQGSGVNAAKAWDLLGLEPRSQAFAGVPVAAVFRVIGDDQRGTLYLFRLEVFGYAVHPVLGRNAVIAYHRVGRDQDLALVGGVCQALGVAGHRGIEYQLAGDGFPVPEGFGGEDRPVFQYQFCVFHYLQDIDEVHEKGVRGKHGG